MVALEGRRRQRPAGRGGCFAWRSEGSDEREAADVAPPRGQFRPHHRSTTVKTRRVSSILPRRVGGQSCTVLIVEVSIVPGFVVGG